jgi:hypothetical protein
MRPRGPLARIISSGGLRASVGRNAVHGWSRAFPKVVVALLAVSSASAGASVTAVRHLVLVNGATGAVSRAFPDVDSEVQTAVADGGGGWYVGGDFQRVGNVARPFLARDGRAPRSPRRTLATVAGTRSHAPMAGGRSAASTRIE